MKNTVFLFFALFLFFCSQSIVAQQISQVNMETASISKGQQPAYIINIPGADINGVIKSWEKLIRQNTKSKVEESGGEISILGTQINELYHSPINIYSLIYKEDTTIRVVAVFEIDSAFFDFNKLEATHTNQKTQNQILDFMKNFAIAEYTKVVAGQLDFEEGKLDELNDDLKDLEKENESLQKEIKSNEQKIKNSQDAIQTYETENARLLLDIANKTDDVSRAVGDEVRQKKAKDELKSLEKNKKSVENSLEKEQKNIVEYESGIKSLNRDVEANEKLQEDVQASITTQQEVVKKAQAKLAGIK